MKNARFATIITKAIFKLGPTLLIALYLWTLTNATTSEFRAEPTTALLVLSCGLVVAFFVYSYRLRLLTSLAILLGMVYGVYAYLSGQVGGEFDAFHYAITFSIYATTFVVFWLVGYGFARISWFPWAVSLVLVIASVSFVVANFNDLHQLVRQDWIEAVGALVFDSMGILHRLLIALFLIFGPILLYAIYMVFNNEMLEKMTAVDRSQVQFLVRRSSLLAFLVVFLLLASFRLLAWLQSGLLEDKLVDVQAGSADFLQQTTNPETNQPEFDLKEYAQLLPEVHLSDETVFCTYIDNFFPLEDGGQAPLPVHFRRYVLNLYEPETEKFVLDPYPPSSIPNDLFSPDIRDLPIGFFVEDSVIRTSTSKYDYRKDISSLVYIQTLSPDAYLAPNTGYYYQKLPVPPDDKEVFHTAYQCSSLISIWNLPPFVYSSTNPELALFREQRAQAMNLDRSYAGFDSIFMDYYTRLDTTDTLIMSLSEELTAGASTPYQKVANVIDYFLGTEEDGTPRFTYTLEPGAPNDPDQSMMHYFLSENKKGYCTYFAGATTLLLRAAGIPCRVVVGYAIVDRSNKNTGWYWVYADQGHAWLEVYFPSFGWVDFDTTPSDDNEVTRPPKPDATPPAYAQNPGFAVLGEVVRMNADTTGLVLRPYSVRLGETTHKIVDTETEDIILVPDGRQATVGGDKVDLREIDAGRQMIASAYSFDAFLADLPEYDENIPMMEWLSEKFPAEIPVDEAFIVYEAEPEEKGQIFAVEGVVDTIDLATSIVQVTPEKIVYREREFAVDTAKFGSINLSPEEAIFHDDGDKVSFAELTVDDTLQITAHSSSETIHRIKPYLATEPFASWFHASFPKNIPVERIEIINPETPAHVLLARGLFGIFILAVILLMAFPSLTYVLLNMMARLKPGNRAHYWSYRFALMLLNQVGLERDNATPLEYAKTQVDPEFKVNFARFMTLYQYTKYSGQPLAESDEKFLNEFRSGFAAKVLSQLNHLQVLLSFLNVGRTMRFLLR